MSTDNVSAINNCTNWINLQGSWITNIVVLVAIRATFSIIPGISNDLAWTLTVLAYNTCTFIMFHWVIGTPIDFAQNEDGNLTLWEQIDNGVQFTPTKKYLMAVPILLFLVSTHWSHYNLDHFMISLGSTVVVVVAKLPVLHRVRFLGMNQRFDQTVLDSFARFSE